eukprot:GHVU01225041.1.p5 GENE.GHVU01225041.1~~GHVU01225041.1.p5  ORF type:complete len:101 (-),score=0.97 GHVU01225041.1:1081-1383(-)
MRTATHTHLRRHGTVMAPTGIHQRREGRAPRLVLLPGHDGSGRDRVVQIDGREVGRRLRGEVVSGEEHVVQAPAGFPEAPSADRVLRIDGYTDRVNRNRL